MSKERRKFERFDVTIDFFMLNISGKGRFFAVPVNVSKGGLMVDLGLEEHVPDLFIDDHVVLEEVPVAMEDTLKNREGHIAWIRGREIGIKFVAELAE